MAFSEGFHGDTCSAPRGSLENILIFMLFDGFYAHALNIAWTVKGVM